MKHAKEKLRIHVGDGLEETGLRFIGAWRALEKGKRIRERHLSFESLEGLLSLLTPKRWELLKFVHRNPVPSIRALSVELRRDYRRVHDDVEALACAGLLERDGRAVRADYDGLRRDRVMVSLRPEPVRQTSHLAGCGKRNFPQPAPSLLSLPGGEKLRKAAIFYPGCGTLTSPSVPSGPFSAPC